eukprot:GSA120T00007685001.1
MNKLQGGALNAKSSKNSKIATAAFPKIVSKVSIENCNLGDVFLKIAASSTSTSTTSDDYSTAGTAGAISSPSDDIEPEDYAGRGAWDGVNFSQKEARSHKVPANDENEFRTQQSVSAAQSIVKSAKYHSIDHDGRARTTNARPGGAGGAPAATTSTAAQIVNRSRSRGSRALSVASSGAVSFYEEGESRTKTTGTKTTTGFALPTRKKKQNNNYGEDHLHVEDDLSSNADSVQMSHKALVVSRNTTGQKSRRNSVGLLAGEEAANKPRAGAGFLGSTLAVRNLIPFFNRAGKDHEQCASIEEGGRSFSTGNLNNSCFQTCQKRIRTSRRGRVFSALFEMRWLTTRRDFQSLIL